jgi:hypothetical protein
MSKRKKATKGSPMTTATKWTPFVQVEPTPNLKSRETDPEGYDQLWNDYKSGITKMYKNSLYTCHVRQLGALGDDGTLWISIRSNDRKAVRDWRHFQRIKNELAGEEREALEIYPKESELVDEANSYHLWVLASTDRMPFGFHGERKVGSAEDAEKIGAGQRDPEDE